MKIAFHGAAQTVTGSKHLVTLANKTNILLDCGLFQGMGRETETLNRTFGFNAAEVDVMVLSHAHIDHTGLIPKLVKDGFRGKIFCTPATKELTAILLQDSAHIQESDARFHNKGSKAQGGVFVEPLYTIEDAKACMEKFVTQEYGQWFPIHEQAEAMFTDAGHIVGSACVHLRLTENDVTKALTFSGDVGRYRDVILKSPEPFPQADFIVMESTYGNSLHKDNATSVDMLLSWINKTCLEKKGKLVIPAFSLGRTQEILYALNQLDLEKRLPKLNYYLDSPLSMDITDAIKKYSNTFNKTIQKLMQSDSDPFMFPNLHYIETVEASKQLNFSNEPCVIIAASGMADAGRVKHHISNTIESTRNSILFTGYCEPHSLGGRLIDGDKEVKIFGIEHQVHAAIASLKSMSAHGDYEDLCQWLACQNPKAVQQLFLVHGEPSVQFAFRERLISKGFSLVEVPTRHQVVGL